jgi:hypothetical protein
MTGLKSDAASGEGDQEQTGLNFGKPPRNARFRVFSRTRFSFSKSHSEEEISVGTLSDSIYAIAAGSVGNRLGRNLRLLRAQRYFAGSVYLGLGAATGFDWNAEEIASDAKCNSLTEYLNELTSFRMS